MKLFLWVIIAADLLSILFCVSNLSRTTTDSWQRHSDNRFAYNICSLYSSSSSSSGIVLQLPLAHTAIALEPEAARKRKNHCPNLIPNFHNGSEVLGSVCNKLLQGEQVSEKEEAWIAGTNQWLREQETDVTKLIRYTKNCTWVKEYYTEKNFHVTKRELEFPIAYAMNVDQHPYQVLRFLRSIYRSHNLYCIHLDWKSSHAFKEVFFNVASCLGNVILPRKLEDTYRGWHTLLDAHRSCFQDLELAATKGGGGGGGEATVAYPWKYVITLCGMELPLRTNAEIVALLEPLKGMSSVHTVGEEGRDDFKFKWKWRLNKMTHWISKRDALLPLVPHGLSVYKSSTYLALSRAFIRHVLCSPVAIALARFMRDVRIPEENVYAMLFMQPGAPGGYREEEKKKIFPITSSIWMDGDSSSLNRLRMAVFPRTFCSGRSRHNVCLVGSKDLHKLSYKPGIVGYRGVVPYMRTDGKIRFYQGPDRGPLFHNKFSLEDDHVMMQCMERELGRRNSLELKQECDPHSRITH